MLILDFSLDYEVKIFYGVVMEIVDIGKILFIIGIIIVKVRSFYCVVVFFKKVINNNLI